MQFMMMSRNRLYNWLLHPTINFLILVYDRVAPWCPRWFLRGCAIIVVFVMFVLRPKYVRVVMANLRIILKNSVGTWMLLAITYRIYINFSRYFVDLFYFRDKSHDTISSYLDEVTGVPTFEQTLAEGRGAVLLTAHLGNWELGGYFLGRKRLPINVVYHQDRFSRLEEFRSRNRQLMHVNEINVGTGWFSGLPIIKALRRNEIVAMQGDRDFRGGGCPVMFFDHEVCFPSGPVVCAMVAGSPIIPVFILSSVSGKYSIVAGEPLEMPGSIREPEDIRYNVQRVARVIESMVSRHYDQWYCFYPFFEQNIRSDQQVCQPKGRVAELKALSRTDNATMDRSDGPATIDDSARDSEELKGSVVP